MLQIGSVIKSIAGHDKDRFYAVVGFQKDCVKIADGKMRKLEKPKTKNIKHVRMTKTVLEPENITTDRRLRLALAPFRDTANQEEHEGGN